MVTYKRRFWHYVLVTVIGLGIGYAISFTAMKEGFYASINFDEKDGLHLGGRLLAMFLISVLLYAHGRQQPQFMDSFGGNLWDSFFHPHSLLKMAFIFLVSPYILTYNIIAYVLYAPFLVVMTLLECVGIVKSSYIGASFIPKLVAAFVLFVFAFALGRRWGMIPDPVVTFIDKHLTEMNELFNRFMFGLIGLGLEE